MSEQFIQATHGSMEHPLRIGDMEIPCFVLEDGRRVLLQTQMVDAIGISAGGSSNPEKMDRLARNAAQMGIDLSQIRTDRLTRFVFGGRIQPFISDELIHAVSYPIRFKTPQGRVVDGYEASILAEICEAVLKAREAGQLQKQQLPIAKKCEILVRGFARVGIIALVDEATGYQDFRARQALEEILRKFISAELAKWAKTFPDDFYKHLFRLRGLSYSEVSTKRPMYIGKLTNDIVYERLAPQVLEELKRVAIRGEDGKPKHKYFQRLTEDVGIPALKEHLSNVITLMKASPNWNVFYRLLQRALPKYDENIQLVLPHRDFDEDINI